MKFTFTEKKMDASADLRAYAERKVGKLDRLFKTESNAYLTFSTERGRFLAEITIENNGLYYRASELTSDMYASVDSGVAAIERQIRKNKTRLEKRLREGALEREVKPSYAPAEEDEDEEFKIVRSKRFSIKPMSPEEAILQMNLLEHEFFVFRNDEEDEPSPSSTAAETAATVLSATTLPNKKIKLIAPSQGRGNFKDGT